MATERAIRLLNDEAIRYLAKEKYNDAAEVLRSCLEQFLPRRMVPALDDRGENVVFPVQPRHHQPSDASSQQSSSFLHPLPTAIMSPSNDSTSNLFRECFMLWAEDRVAEAVPGANGNEESSRETSLSDKSALLCGTVLLFNLGLVHHLRGLTTTTTQAQGDLEQAEKCYKLALSTSLELVNNQARAAAAFDDSACWLLVLTIANNLGCIACEASNHETVQECLSLGKHAMKHINLPLFWSNQFTWCSPSAAA